MPVTTTLPAGVGNCWIRCCRLRHHPSRQEQQQQQLQYRGNNNNNQLNNQSHNCTHQHSFTNQWKSNNNKINNSRINSSSLRYYFLHHHHHHQQQQWKVTVGNLIKYNSQKGGYYTTTTITNHIIRTQRTTATFPRTNILRRTTTTSTSASSTISNSNNDPKNHHDEEIEKNWKMYPIGFGIGSIAGLFGSLAGMGGGFIMIPLLTSTILGGLVRDRPSNIIGTSAAASSKLLNQHQAHGTSLCAVAATGFAGALSYGDYVQYDIACMIACTGMITAQLGAKFGHTLSSRTLKRYLGILMLLMAPIVPLKAYLFEEQEQQKQQQEQESLFLQTVDTDHEKVGKNLLLTDSNRMTMLISPIVVVSSPSSTNPSTTTLDDTKTITTISKKIENNNFAYYQYYMIPASIGLGSGFLAGLFGVGGGVLVVPALTLFCSTSSPLPLPTTIPITTPTTQQQTIETHQQQQQQHVLSSSSSYMNHHTALGTSLAAMTLPAMMGTYTHYKLGTCHMRIAPFLTLGALVGSYFGGQLSIHTNETYLRYGFTGILTTLGLRTLLKA